VDEGQPCDDLDPDTCFDVFQSGECVGEPRPIVCPANFDPVCGEDGMTYGNACVAASNCVKVEHEGECIP